ncbi:acyl-CoA carboxylase epsilon subunit [Streptomyces sp. NPDC001848]|uniref:acyl-CoA carboxylase epsilon subunit n=1 Tax=Streptomyces sp. NPDC001848 TaxID=3364618 RepID=UPI003688975B
MSATTIPARHILRVVKGHAEPDELAALTAVLLARAAAPAPDPGDRARARPRWRRLERELSFRAPHSWRG